MEQPVRKNTNAMAAVVFSLARLSMPTSSAPHVVEPSSVTSLSCAVIYVSFYWRAEKRALSGQGMELRLSAPPIPCFQIAGSSLWAHRGLHAGNVRSYIGYDGHAFSVKSRMRVRSDVSFASETLNCWESRLPLGRSGTHERGHIHFRDSELPHF